MNLFTNRRRNNYRILHRWEIDGFLTSWTTYKVFKKESERNEFLKNLLKREMKFIEYKASN